MVALCPCAQWLDLAKGTVTASRLGMLNFAFLRTGSAGGEMRKSWSNDKPLAQADGGSAAAITHEKMSKSSDSLRHGGVLLGLTTLCSFSTDFSFVGIRYSMDRIEAFGRKKFTISRHYVVRG